MYELYDDNSTAIDQTKKGSVPTNKIVPLHGMGISKFSEGVSDLDQLKIISEVVNTETDLKEEFIRPGMGQSTEQRV